MTLDEFGWEVCTDRGEIQTKDPPWGMASVLSWGSGEEPAKANERPVR